MLGAVDSSDALVLYRDNQVSKIEGRKRIEVYYISLAMCTREDYEQMECEVSRAVLTRLETHKTSGYFVVDTSNHFR